MPAILRFRHARGASDLLCGSDLSDCSGRPLSIPPYGWHSEHGINIDCGSLSAVGVETGLPHALQVCTGVMLHGYPLVKTLCGGLQVLY